MTAVVAVAATATKGCNAATGPCALVGAARRLLQHRDRVAALAPWGDGTPSATLAQAIERDFALFDVERAEADLRAALAALCGMAPAAERGVQGLAGIA